VRNLSGNWVLWIFETWNEMDCLTELNQDEPMALPQYAIWTTEAKRHGFGEAGLFHDARMQTCGGSGQ
jgi:hypothetical protein